MTVPPNLLEVECLEVAGESVPLLKCPYCKFRSIHQDVILHHILWKDDIPHQVDITRVDKNRFFIPKSKRQDAKEDLPLPWIKCPWCDYKDKIERDLEWHFIQSKCRIRLYKMKVEPYELSEEYTISPGDRLKDWEWNTNRFSEYNTEYRVKKAMELARRNSGIKSSD